MKTKNWNSLQYWNAEFQCPFWALCSKHLTAMNQSWSSHTSYVFGCGMMGGVGVGGIGIKCIAIKIRCLTTCGSTHKYTLKQESTHTHAHTNTYNRNIFMVQYKHSIALYCTVTCWNYQIENQLDYFGLWEVKETNKMLEFPCCLFCKKKQTKKTHKPLFRTNYM